METFQTIVDKDGKYMVIDTSNSHHRQYGLAHCDVPELYSMEATLEGINRYYHYTLMEHFESMGCKLITKTLK